ncbi:hypothetical protein ON010_g11437 [Phytophthora cinnamomi]|nr:hypothetical protein ON010_g11437 [Phytophthora cinnamomi]
MLNSIGASATAAGDLDKVEMDAAQVTPLRGFSFVRLVMRSCGSSVLGLGFAQQGLEALDESGDAGPKPLVPLGRSGRGDVGEVDEPDVGCVRVGPGLAVVQEQEGAGDELRALLLVEPRPEFIQTPQKLNGMCITNQHKSVNTAISSPPTLSSQQTHHFQQLDDPGSSPPTPNTLKATANAAPITAHPRHYKTEHSDMKMTRQRADGTDSGPTTLLQKQFMTEWLEIPSQFNIIAGKSTDESELTPLVTGDATTHWNADNVAS